jgi:VanZ family protein
MRQQPAKHVWWRIVWAVLIVLVVIGSLLPADSVIMEKLDALPVNDKVQHFAAYAALAFVPTLHESATRLGIFLGFVVVLGVLLEYGQLYSPGRSFDVNDMLADGIGVLAGFFIGRPLRAWRLS